MTTQELSARPRLRLASTMTVMGRNLLLKFAAEPARQLDKKGLVFEKEIVRAGEFTKSGRSGKVTRHVIDERMLDGFVRNFAEMKRDGVHVPVPVEHTVDPEKRRGTVTDMTKRPNGSGVPAVFARIEFRDAEAAKMAQTAGVSVYVPDKIHNGTLGKDYHAAVEHVALTDYPVINDLAPFKPLALSLKMENDMTLKDLAAQMGVDPSITDEQQMLLAMSMKLQQMRGPQQPPAPAPGQPAAPPRPPGPAPARPFGMSREPIALSGTLLAMAVENRETKIGRLVERRLITPAVAKDLKATYCTDDALAFSHAEDFNDGFDAVVGALAKNSPVIPDGKKTGKQAVALSKDADGRYENPLVANAVARAEAAKSNGHQSYS